MTDMTMGMEPQEGQTVIDRNPPQVDPSRAALAKRWTSAIQSAKAHPRIKNAFRKMREDMRFAAGCQYPDQMEEGAERYLANLVQRQIDRKRGVRGTSMSVRVDCGGGRIIQKKNNKAKK